MKCNNKNCSVSSDIFDNLTFGSVKLDRWGYWEHPCIQCAKDWKRKYPHDSVVPDVDENEET